ncbi:MAG: FecR family protein [Bacteroidota bacterium]
MSNYSEGDWERAARFLAGETSADERAAFQQWIEASPDRQIWFNGVRTLWDQSGGGAAEVDVDAAWSYVRQQIIGRERPRRATRRPIRRKNSGAAARMTAIFAAILIAVGIAWRTADDHPVEALPEPQVFAVKRGEVLNLTLGDGTRVVLNADSRLEVGTGFGSSRRQVQLKGEALFDVTPDPDRPFIVDAERGSMHVVGTRFVVRDRGETLEPFTVAVDEGAVRAETPTGAHVIEAGEVAALGSDGLTLESITDRDIFFGWIHGRLVFRDVPLAEVVPRLERWYNIDIELGDRALGDRRLTTSFDQAPTDDALSVVALTLELHLERSDGIYRLSSSSPNRN